MHGGVGEVYEGVEDGPGVDMGAPEVGVEMGREGLMKGRL